MEDERERDERDREREMEDKRGRIIEEEGANGGEREGNGRITEEKRMDRKEDKKQKKMYET